jgi:D-alanyl-D-alanine carboxypeptidase
MRLPIHVVFAVFLSCALAFSGAQAKGSKRHKDVYFVGRDASLIVDAETGKVLEESKSNEVRHPASLTKMMTLYLTFEALEKKRIKLTDMMPVSRYAAHQAPTKLDLMAGDKLKVEDAIKALVVRSANDAAVVLAEYLGNGSEATFAKAMTAKARALGMKQTYYKNASGLPDARQVTSARDLAVLGMALRRHFPQYYHYFNTREFVLNGVTYTTHNHVMERYPWADGLKTGYIRMSGFNLVTSAKKDGHMLVGVVLGGNTVRERDDKMIALLNDAFDRMNKQNNIRSLAALVKVPPRGKMQGETEVAEADEASAPRVAEAYDPGYAAGVAEGDADSAESPKPGWGVQVGMFGAQKDAMSAALDAQKLAGQELGGAKVRVESEQSGQVPIHRARLENLSQEQAHNACRRLAAQREPCFVYRVGAVM